MEHISLYLRLYAYQCGVGMMSHIHVKQLPHMDTPTEKGDSFCLLSVLLLCKHHIYVLAKLYMLVILLRKCQEYRNISMYSVGPLFFDPNLFYNHTRPLWLSPGQHCSWE